MGYFGTKKNLFFSLDIWIFIRIFVLLYKKREGADYIRGVAGEYTPTCAFFY
jgi:hypothetical protein